MTSQEEFTQKMEATQRRLEELVRQGEVDPASDSLLKTALGELQVLSEELFVTDAELREQNDELARGRDILEEERQRYQDLFEFAPDGYLVTDGKGKILEANRSATRLFNLEARFLIGKPFPLYIVREESYDFRRQLRRLGSSPPTIERIEHWEVRLQPRDGEPFFASLTAQAVPEGIRWLIRDVHERKRMQAELEEVRLRLVEGHEQERLSLAKLLHDGPLQDLYGLVFQLNVLSISGEIEDWPEEVANLQNELLVVIDTLRTLLGDMRPPALTHFGLERAIHSHARNFQADYPDLKIYLDLLPERQSLPENLRVALFRIYQQAMLNVVQHAQASQAWVRLTFDQEAQIRLEIQDNGIGFKVLENWVSFVRDGRLGLAEAAEQAASIGGKLEVKSEPGSGTVVKVTAPFE